MSKPHPLLAVASKLNETLRNDRDSSEISLSSTLVGDNGCVKMAGFSPGFEPPHSVMRHLAGFMMGWGDSHQYYYNSGRIFNGSHPEVQSFMAEKGIIAPDRKIDPENTVFANGVTQLYAATLQSLVGPKDVVVFPVPTYASFAKAPALRKENMRTIDLKPEDNYHITPEALEKALDNIVNKAEPDSKIWLVFINPHNPTGALHDQSEVNALAKILEQPRFHNVHIISDMVLAGTEHGHAAVAGSFAAVPALADRTITYHGLSKAYGGAGLRAGIAIGPKNMVRALTKHVQYENDFTNVPSQAALIFTYKLATELPQDWYMHPDKAKFDDALSFNDYVVTTKMIYGNQQQLVEELVNGNDKEWLESRAESPSFLVATKKGAFGRLIISDEYKQEFAKVFQYSIDHDGIPGMEILHRPEAGFHQLIDVTGLIGKYYGEKKLDNSVAVKEMLHEQGIDVASGDQCLHPDPGHVIRVSFGIHPIEIIKGISRMQQTVELLKDQPSKLPEMRHKEAGRTL